MRAYQYRCKDHSLITPIFKKVFVEPIMVLMPWAIPANIITIVSNLLMYVALYLAINKEVLGELNFLVIPALFILYLIGDHLDGAQAKRTGTGSALGEFCDHYLDAFNNGILMYCLFSLYNVTNVWLIAALLLTSYLAHVIVFYEQYKTGWIIFEKLGSLEGVILSAGIIVASYFEPVRLFFSSTWLFDLSVFEWFLVFTAIGGIWTFIITAKRIPHITYGLWLFTVTTLIISIFSALMFGVLGMTIIVTLYSSWYIGKLMKGHLVDGIEPSPGLFSPLFIIAAYMIESIMPSNTLLILAAYIGINIILLVYRTFNALKTHWVWINPPKI